MRIKLVLSVCYFFFSYKTQTTSRHSIQDVQIATSVFFATLRILPIGYSAQENWVEIRYLKKKDAELARRIIAGLLIGTKAGIDLTKVERKQITNDIANLGTIN